MSGRKKYHNEEELALGIAAAVTREPRTKYISVLEVVYRMHDDEYLTALYNQCNPAWVRSSITSYLKKQGYIRRSPKRCKNPVYMKVDYDPSR